MYQYQFRFKDLFKIIPVTIAFSFMGYILFTALLKEEGVTELPVGKYTQVQSSGEAKKECYRQAGTEIVSSQGGSFDYQTLKAQVKSRCSK